MGAAGLGGASGVVRATALGVTTSPANTPPITRESARRESGIGSGGSDGLLTRGSPNLHSAARIFNFGASSDKAVFVRTSNSDQSGRLCIEGVLPIHSAQNERDFRDSELSIVAPMYNEEATSRPLSARSRRSSWA